MNKVIAWLKSIRLAQVLMVFLAGVLVFFSTACNGAATATSPGGTLGKTSDEIREEVPDKGVTNSRYQGGMNDYSDVDPRMQNPGAAQSKAEDLVENARRNLEKSVDSPEQYVENYRSGTPLGERVRKLGEDVGESGKDVQKDVSTGTKENLRRVTGATEETAQDAATRAKDAANRTSNAAEDAATRAKRAADRTSDAAGTQVDRGVRSAQRSLDDAADTSESLGEKIQQTAQDAADAVKSTVDKGTNAAQRALNNTADTLN